MTAAPVGHCLMGILQPGLSGGRQGYSTWGELGQRYLAINKKAGAETPLEDVT